MSRIIRQVTRLARLRSLGACLGLGVLLQGTGCDDLRKAFPPGDSAHLMEQSMLLTRVNPHRQVVHEGDAIFEPDFHYRLPSGATGWAFTVAIKTDGNFAFQATLQQPTPPSGTETPPLAIEQFPGERVSASGTEFNPYDPIRHELEANQRMVARLASGTPTWFMQAGGIDNRESYFLTFLVPENLIPDREVGTARLRVFNRFTEKDGTVKDYRAAELQLTKNAVFNVLAIGDSIMWGQGLKEEQKFTNLVAKQILNDTGRPVRVFRYAHSGAVVQGTADGCPVEASANPRHGEISRAEGQPEFASSRVPCQLDRFMKRTGNPDIHLVLATGCANDVDLNGLASYILLPFQNRSEEQATMYNTCKTGMESLLKQLRARTELQNAPIIVTGYYSPVTEGSLGKQVHLDERTGSWGELFFRDNVIPQEPIDKSRDWKLRSDEGLRDAVNAVGGRSARIIFAGLQDPGSQSGIFAATPIVHDYTQANIDDLVGFRGRICEAHGRKGDYFCLGAGIFHPNLRGAELYKQTIVDAMKALDSYPVAVDGHSARGCPALKVTEADAEKEWIDAEKNPAHSLFLLKAEVVRSTCN